MTRGSAWYLGVSRVLESMEFNGDMYPEEEGGLGDEFLNAISVTTEEEFIEAIAKFNLENHNYAEDYTQIYNRENTEIYDVEQTVNFNNDYFSRFFSDWVFFINNTGEDVIFITVDSNEEVVLKNGESIRFNFGRIYEESKEVVLK